MGGGTAVQGADDVVRLDKFDTSNPAVMQILLYAAVLTVLISRELLGLVIDSADDEAVFLPRRGAAILRSHAQRILDRLGTFSATRHRSC